MYADVAPRSRVEIAMRPSISSAIKTSKSTRKKAKLSRSAQAKQDADEEEARLYKPPPRSNASGKERASEFAGREKVALNDVAQEPPTLVKMQNKKAEKALQANVKSKPKKELPVSMKQKEEMEQERQKAIAMYVTSSAYFALHAADIADLQVSGSQSETNCVQRYFLDYRSTSRPPHQ